MCGIVGVFPLNKTNLEMEERKRRIAAIYLHNEILFETVARGKDATGISVCFRPNPEVEGSVPFWTVIKQPVDTWSFFRNDGTESRYKDQDEDANVERIMDAACLIDLEMYHIIGHTRAKTVGSEFSPLNNHPIMVGNIIGVHNGGVKNYQRIYDKHDKMTQQGQVDSEVIMQLLAETANDRALDVEDINYVTSRIEGPRAVIAYNRHYPSKVIFFHDKDRPLELAYIPEIGCAVIHSERKFLERALHVYDRARLTVRRDLPELSVDYRYVRQDSGGLIDLDLPVNDEEQKVEDIFPLIDYTKTTSEYLDPIKTTGTSRYTKTTGTGTTGTTKKSVEASATKATDSMATVAKKSGPKLPEADIKDLSQYRAESIACETSETVQSKKVPSDQIMDDTDEDTDTVNEGASGAFSEAELREEGVNLILSPEAAKDKSLFPNRHRGNLARWFAAAIKEDEAEEMVQQMYPEAFGEGYAKGWRAGAAAEADSRDDEDFEEKLLEMTEDYEKLKRRFEKLEAKHRKEVQKRRGAAAFISNMKMFLIAAMIVKELGWVEEENGKTRVVFCKEIEEFLQVAVGFEKLDPEMVRGIFTKSDAKRLGRGVSALSKQLGEKNEDKQQNQ